MAADRPRPTSESPARELERIGVDVAACRACPRLVDWREQVARDKRAAYVDDDYWGRGVPAFGDPEAGLMVVGLAPAAHGANRTGRMFTGDRSGDWLFRAMHRAGFANQPTSDARGDGLELIDALVTSPVKCAPPANKPSIVERDTCRRFFERELAVVEPRVLVALGGFAFKVVSDLFEVRPRPTFGHGVEVEVGNGVVMIGSYHVSQQNTFTGRLTEAMLDDVFARARAVLDTPALDTPALDT